MPKTETNEQRFLRLEKELEETIQALDREKAEKYEQKVKEVAETMRANGVFVEDVAAYLSKGKRPDVWPSHWKATRGTKRKKSAKPVPLYFNPANPAETWSGRGREPEWATPFQTSNKPRKYKDAISIETQTAKGKYKPV